MNNLWHSFIHPVTGYFRKRRSEFLLNQFPKIREWSICDVGGSRHFWDKLEIDIPKKNITIYNTSRDATESVGNSDSSEIPVHLYDGFHIPAKDRQFDLVICNSVLEHVPVNLRENLVREMFRISKNLFCQTPAFEFPVDPHFVMPFIHWFPKKIGYWLALLSPWRLMAKPSKHVIEEYFWGTNLLSKKKVQMLFPGKEVLNERFFGLVKSYYVISKN